MTCGVRNRASLDTEQLQLTLTALLPSPLRPTDMTDDRLADALYRLSEDTAWTACEGDLNQTLLWVYNLTPTTVRVGGTTASSYWEVSEDGLFQFEHSKDQRPDQPQVKVMLATLNPSKGFTCLPDTGSKRSQKRVKRSESPSREFRIPDCSAMR